MIIYEPYMIIELNHIWTLTMFIYEHSAWSHMSIWHVRIWSYVRIICEHKLCSHMIMNYVHIWVLIYEHFLDNNICVRIWVLTYEQCQNVHMWAGRILTYEWSHMRSYTNIGLLICEHSYVNYIYDCSYVSTHMWTIYMTAHMWALICELSIWLLICELSIWVPVWLFVYDCSYMTVSIWLLICDCSYVPVHMWLLIYM